MDEEVLNITRQQMIFTTNDVKHQIRKTKLGDLYVTNNLRIG